MNSTLATFFSIVVGFDVGYCFEPAACRLVSDECGCYDGSRAQRTSFRISSTLSSRYNFY